MREQPIDIANAFITDSSHDAQVLLKRIKDKRQKIATYVIKKEPRHIRLINLSIISGALAATLTAGPGVGGNEFINAMKNTISLGIPIWQLFCLLATIFSLTAVVTNGILKSSDLKTRIATALSCDAKLEGLEMMLELEQMDVKKAASLYAKYLIEIPYV